MKRNHKLATSRPIPAADRIKGDNRRMYSAHRGTSVNDWITENRDNTPSEKFPVSSSFGTVSIEKYKQIHGLALPTVRYRVLPYKQGSKAARDLARELNGLLLRVEGSQFTPKDGDVIVNWGSSRPHERLGDYPVLNPPAQVKIATDKLEFFKLMRESASVYTPDFWIDPEDIPADAYPVVCRTVLNGHSGEGIVIANDPEELVKAPLYVKYIKKTDEYRVHVGKEQQIIAVQRKARRRSVPDEAVNWQIRNHENGFVYVRQNVSAPPIVTSAAIKSLLVSGLDFGAVDVIYNEQRRVRTAKVLEINTAPGLAGQTVRDYARYFESRKGYSNGEK